eukprot:2087005-Pleurochrysis_carterae.AAC.4
MLCRYQDSGGDGPPVMAIWEVLIAGNYRTALSVRFVPAGVFARDGAIRGQPQAQRCAQRGAGRQAREAIRLHGARPAHTDPRSPGHACRSASWRGVLQSGSPGR